MNQRTAESRIEQAIEPAHSQLKPQNRSTRRVKKPIGIMGLATLLLTTAAVVFMPVTAQAWDWSPLKPSYTYPFEDSGVSIWTSRIGTRDYTYGNVGGRNVSIWNDRIGTRDYTSGKVGSSSVSLWNNRIGNSDYTTGKVGRSSVSLWNNRIGNSDYTTGRIGARPSLRTSSLFSWWD